MLPGLYHENGLEIAYAGRVGGDEPGRDVGERLTVSVWGPGTDAAAIAQPFDFERFEGAEEISLDVMPVVVALTGVDPELPQILRVLRGTTRPGELDEYADELRTQTLGDIEAGGGPSILFVGVREHDDFITVSAWSSWERIGDATGGNIRQPEATRRAKRLVSATAEYYEIVPNTLAARPTAPIVD